MKQIALKNFRKFIEFPGKEIESGMLDLNDITLLVGKNNAGKSTLVKAMILVIENLKRRTGRPFVTDAYFNFRSNKHKLHVDTFARAINNDTKDKIITFKIRLGEFIIAIDVEEANDVLLYNHLQQEEDATAPIKRIEIDYRGGSVAVEFFPHLQYVNVSITPQTLNVLSSDDLFRYDENAIRDEIRSLRKELEKANDNGDIFAVLDLQDKISVEENRLKKIKSLASADKADSINITLRSEWMPYSESWENDYPIIMDLKAIAHYQGGDFLAKDKKKMAAIYNAINNNRSLLQEMTEELTKALNSVSYDYIQAHLASQEIMLNPNDPDNMMAKVVDQYVTFTEKFDRNKSIRNFILKWMSKEDNEKNLKYFDIGTDFMIDSYPGHNYVMKIKDFHDKWVNISDMGMGTNQLLILLFQVANNIAFGRKTRIIIEEPEQNLHPQIQSLLADFMLEVNQKYGFKFVVETHAEYLIRRAQVLVGKARYKDDADLKSGNPFIVYYFDDNRIVYDMGFKITGAFTEKFGEGFIDVAPLANMEILMNTKKQMINV